MMHNRKFYILFFIGFFALLENVSAAVIFEENFNNQPDWRPTCKTCGKTSPGAKEPNFCQNSGVPILCSSVGGVPVNWDYWNNNEFWNPDDPTHRIPGSQPSHEISGSSYFGLSSGDKAYIHWNESNYWGDGSTYTNDGILTKAIPSQKELWVQIKIKLSVPFYWSEGVPNSYKIIRIVHYEDNSDFAPFSGNDSVYVSGAGGTGGSNVGPLYIYDLAYNPSPYGFRSMNSTRCGPLKTDWVRYNGAIYNCIKNHTSTEAITPANTAYWRLQTSYSANDSRFQDWSTGNEYVTSNYYCNYVTGSNSPYDGASPMATLEGVQSNSFANTFGDGNWHTIKIHVKMNSAPGVSDGIEELWVNGFLSKSASNIQFIGKGGDSAAGFNLIGIGGNALNHFVDTWKYSNYNTWEKGEDVIWNGYHWEALQDTYGIDDNQSPNNHPDYWKKGSFEPSAEQWYAIDDVVVSTSPIDINYAVKPFPIIKNVFLP